MARTFKSADDEKTLSLQNTLRDVRLPDHRACFVPFPISSPFIAMRA
jgi:hypothetical protein